MRKFVLTATLLLCGLVAAAIAQGAGASSHGASDIWTLQNKVYFQEGSASIGRQYASALDSIVASFRTDRTQRYEARGHCDYASGRGAENFQLAVARASAVKNYLTARGIPGKNVTISAYGRPAVNDPSQSGAEGRRVDVMLITPRQGYEAPPPATPARPEARPGTAARTVRPEPAKPAPKHDPAPKTVKSEPAAVAKQDLPAPIQKLPNTQILDLDAIGYSIALTAQPAPMFEEVSDTDEPEPEPEPVVEEVVEAAAVYEMLPVAHAEPVAYTSAPVQKKKGFWKRLFGR